MPKEIERSSMYFIGIEETDLKRIADTDIGTYVRFLNDHVDYFSFCDREVVWIKEPDFPELRKQHPTDEDYMKAVLKELEKHVPAGLLHVYRQTLITEELE